MTVPGHETKINVLRAFLNPTNKMEMQMINVFNDSSSITTKFFRADFFYLPTSKAPTSIEIIRTKKLQIACDSAYLPSSGPLIYNMYDSSKIKW